MLSQITNINSPANNFQNYSTLPGDVVSRVLLFAAAFSGIYFLVRVVISGMNLLTSAGEPEKIQVAKSSLTNSALGLFVVIFAYLIAQLLFSLLGLRPQ
jgi:hypothetical protein